MAAITVHHLTFSYPGSAENVFDDVSFLLDTDWKLGFTGRNGRGKTTFLKLLCGKFPYQGTIASPVSFDYFPFDEDPNQTALQIAEAHDPDGLTWRFLREADLLGLTYNELDRPLHTLSQGERTKVLLAIFFIRDNRFLLIDEPTNHLDMAGRETVSRYLNKKRGFILVSHDRAFLDGCIDHVLSIGRGKITVQQGNYSSFEAQKDRIDRFEAAENEKHLREIGTLRASAKQAGGWADRSESKKIGFDPTETEKNMGRRSYEGMKSKKMQQRRKNLEKRIEREIEEKEELLKDVELSSDLKLSPLPMRGTIVLMQDAVAGYDGRAVTRPVTFSVKTGDRIALCGKNGSGKSSILKLVTGELTPMSGFVKTMSGQIISCVPQSEALSGSLDTFIEKSSVDATLLKTILRKLDFSREMFERPLQEYSAGQQKKVLIARSLCIPAHLYIWDEPLNYIDIVSRRQIAELILRFAPTMMLVEHDRAFIDEIATQTVDL